MNRCSGDGDTTAKAMPSACNLPLNTRFTLGFLVSPDVLLLIGETGAIEVGIEHGPRALLLGGPMERTHVPERASEAALDAAPPDWK